MCKSNFFLLFLIIKLPSLFAAPIEDKIKRPNYKIEKSQFSDSVCANLANEEAYKPTGTEVQTLEFLNNKLINHVQYIECLNNSLDDGEKITSEEKQKEFCENDGDNDIILTFKKLESLKSSLVKSSLKVLKRVQKIRPINCTKFLNKLTSLKGIIKVPEAADGLNQNNVTQSRESKKINNNSIDKKSYENKSK